MSEADKARAWLEGTDWSDPGWLCAVLAEYGEHCASVAREESVAHHSTYRRTIEAERDALAARATRLREALERMPSLALAIEKAIGEGTMQDSKAAWEALDGFVEPLLAEPPHPHEAVVAAVVAAAVALAEAKMAWLESDAKPGWAHPAHDQLNNSIAAYRAAKEAANV